MTSCPSCGAELTGGTPYCVNCGAATVDGIDRRAPPSPAGTELSRPSADDDRSGAALGWSVAALILVATVVAVWWLFPSGQDPDVAGQQVASSPTSSRIPSPTASPTPSSMQSATPSASPSGNWVGTFAAVQSGVAKFEVARCDGFQSTGSGFLVDDDLVVTAAHVVASATDFDVVVAGDTVGGSVIGHDDANDLAVVRLDQAVSGHQFEFDTRPLVIGDEVAAAGYPVTGELSLSRGVVTAVDLAVNVDTDEASGVVRTDAAVNPGNSGGVLLREDGTVAGVVFAKGVDVDVVGVGYALPAEIAAPKVESWVQSDQAVNLGCQDTGARPGESFGAPTVPSWIVVLESLDVDRFTYRDAFDRSFDYDSTLGVVTNVFLSDDYGSLNAGYWVIAVSSFDMEEGAASYCRSIQDAISGCYPRFLDD